MSVYVNPSLWLVNLAVLVYLPLTQRGSSPMKVNVKIFPTWYNFLTSGLNQTNLSDCNHEVVVLWIWKKKRVKFLTSLLRNLTGNICSVQIQYGFSDAVSFYSAGSRVSALNESATGDLRPSELGSCIHTHRSRSIAFCKCCVMTILHLIRYSILFVLVSINYKWID